MSDVEVSIGGNISPFIDHVNSLKHAAAESGEKLGFEFGNRAAYKAEHRLKSGITNAFRSLATSPDLGTAVIGVVESIEKAFRGAGLAFLGFGIGVFLAEQVAQAEESAEKLKKELEGVYRIKPDEQPLRSLKKQIEAFQDLETKYQSRGLLEKILQGNSEDALFKEKKELNEIAKSLVEIEGVKSRIVKNQARELIASANPDDQKRGRLLEKHLADEEEKAEAKNQLDAAIEVREKRQKALAALDARLASAARSARKINGLESIKEEQRLAAEAVHQSDETISALKLQISTGQIASDKENASIEMQAMLAWKKEEDAKLHAAAIKRAELLESEKEIGATPKQKENLQRDQIAEDQRVAGYTFLQTQSQQEELHNKLLEEQIKLKTMLLESDKSRTEMQYEAFQNLTEQGEARAAVQDAQTQAMGFSGKADSMRRLGFGGRVSDSDNSGPLREAQRANEHLKRLELQLNTLVTKIDSA